MTTYLQVIRPTPVSDAVLTSSTVAETDYPLWVAGTNYPKGTRVIRPNHRIYQNAVAGQDATPPENAGTVAPIRWVDIGPTNRWAMFDDVIGTTTTASGAITARLNAGLVSGLALQELTGRKVQVTLRDAPGGKVVYDRTEDLDASSIEDIYDWFFVEYEQRTDVTLNDIPGQYAGELTISLTGTGTVGCGVCQPGRLQTIGLTQKGATTGITDYGQKTRDAFGRYSFSSEKPFSKRMSVKAEVARADYNRVSRLLASLRSTPCIWIASDAPDQEPLRVYGVFKDFTIEVPYATYYLCSIEIEGLV